MDQIIDVLTVLGTLILIVLIFIGAYWFTKFMGRHYKGGIVSSSERIKILEQATIGQDRMIAVVKLENVLLLVGVTSQQITLLKELSPEDFPNMDVSETGGDQQPFSFLLKDALKTWGIGSGGKGGKKE